MAEVSPARAPDPAARTTVREPANNPVRSAPSVPFSQLLGRRPAASNWAHGPGALGKASRPPQLVPEPARAHPQARVRRETGPDREPEGKHGSGALLDPLCCQMAGPAGLTPTVGVSSDPSTRSAALPFTADLQNLLNGLARRAAWGGDRRKGTARIELSEGALAGATLVVHTEQRSVTVELELPVGAGTQGWEARLTERLEARGFTARVRVG